MALGIEDPIDFVGNGPTGIEKLARQRWSAVAVRGVFMFNTTGSLKLNIGIWHGAVQESRHSLGISRDTVVIVTRVFRVIR